MALWVLNKIVYQPFPSHLDASGERGGSVGGGLRGGDRGRPKQTGAAGIMHVERGAPSQALE